MTTITRLYRKDRTHFTISPELDGTLDELVGKQNRSGFVEAATWARLVHVYGVEDVLAAVEDVHAEDSAQRLQTPKQYDLPV